MNVIKKIYKNVGALCGIEPVKLYPEMDKYIYYIDDNGLEKVLFYVKDTKEAVRVLCAMYESRLYNPNDSSMIDVLGTTNIYGFSIEDIANIYGECMNFSDGDRTIRITGDIYNLGNLEFVDLEII